VDRVSRAKVESLIAELRSWPRGELRGDVQQLARRFQLDPMIVKRIAEAEGVVLEPEPVPPPHVAISATDFIRVADIEHVSRKRE
jgi:hypothetical protein